MNIGKQASEDEDRAGPAGTFVDLMISLGRELIDQSKCKKRSVLSVDIKSGKIRFAARSRYTAIANDQRTIL